MPKTEKTNKSKFEVFLEAEDLAILDKKREETGQSRSAYVRQLIRRDLNASKGDKE